MWEKKTKVKTRKNSDMTGGKDKRKNKKNWTVRKERQTNEKRKNYDI